MLRLLDPAKYGHLEDKARRQVSFITLSISTPVNPTKLDLTPDIDLHSSRTVVHQATWRGRNVVVKMLEHDLNEDRIREVYVCSLTPKSTVADLIQIVARPRHYKAIYIHPNSYVCPLIRR